MELQYKDKADPPEDGFARAPPGARRQEYIDEAFKSSLVSQKSSRVDDETSCEGQGHERGVSGQRR